MLVRLGAALCGVATMFAVSVATAKSPTAQTDPLRLKKSASRKIPRAAAHKPALDANGGVSGRRVFVAGVAPFPCKVRPVTFADRFRPAQIAISRQVLEKTKAEDLGVSIIGAASMYNPYRPGYREGGIETASGELYDPSTWTAAIQTGLRGDFGGVGYGKDYRPRFALLESGGKRAVVKINDVGPLVPGRVIDLNQQVMFYFDPTHRRGLVSDVMVTPLPGDGWVPGPVEDGFRPSVAPQMEASNLY
jgi:rare lipoprotein A